MSRGVAEKALPAEAECVLASVEVIFRTHGGAIWCAAIDPGLNEHKYIVPGFGDAGDLCYGEKI